VLSFMLWCIVTSRIQESEKHGLVMDVRYPWTNLRKGDAGAILSSACQELFAL
jgi:hypothetical protein